MQFHSLTIHLSQFKDFYACFDLIEVTLRMNIVMLAKPLMEARDPITSFEQLEELTDDLISVFNQWGKHHRNSLTSCPDLASSHTVTLSTVQEAPPMLDIPDHCYKKLKEDQVEEGWMLTAEDIEMLEEMSVEEERTANVEKVEPATYREYMKGMFQYLE